MSYSSLERVKLALNHKESDRVPFDLGSSAVTGINIKTLKALRTYFGLSNENVKLYDIVTQTGAVDEDLIEKLNIDVKGVDPNPLEPTDVYVDGDNYKLKDELGMIWRMPIKGGHYFDLSYSPLAKVETENEIYQYPWPDINNPVRYKSIKEKAEKITYQEKKAYMLGRHFAGMWETAMWMTGYEKFFCDMVLNKKLVHAIMSKILENKMGYWEKALEAAGETALVISTADDLATQRGLIVSLDLYKEMIWPYHKRLFDFIRSKAKTKVFIFFHNDGATAEAIPLLIEAGIDILNPLQVNCEGMDSKKIKSEYGKDLSFWGAICDAQNILPFGTPKQVRENTKYNIDSLMSGGGWIAAPIHNIQSGVPPENIIAMWETLQEYGKY